MSQEKLSDLLSGAPMPTDDEQPAHEEPTDEQTEIEIERQRAEENEDS